MANQPKTRVYRGVPIYLRHEVDPTFATCSDRSKKWSIEFPVGGCFCEYSHGHRTLKDCAEAIDARLGAVAA